MWNQLSNRSDDSIRRRVGLLTALAVLGFCSLSASALWAQAAVRATAVRAAAPGVWVDAEEIPGSAALNRGGNDAPEALSCTSKDYCAAGGEYEDGSDRYQAFVVNRVKGVWRHAEEVPGTGKLNSGGNAEVEAISCGSPGNCSAGGYYRVGSGEDSAFVVNEVNGKWRDAQQVPGTGTLNAGGYAAVDRISCRSAGNCSAGGDYKNGSGTGLTFVVNEVNGKWRKAQELPGIGTLNTAYNAYTEALSCGSVGNCAIGGAYDSTEGAGQVFVANEVNGHWGRAKELPGLSALNTGDDAGVALSCAARGSCSAGGEYAIGPDHYGAYVASEVKGDWRKATQMPGSAALDAAEDVSLSEISCGAAGGCSAVGSYASGAGQYQVFVVNQVKGKWRDAQPVANLAALNTSGDAGAEAISCGSAGNCAAGGYYYAKDDGEQVFVVNEVQGHWRKAQEVPGSGKLNADNYAGFQAISCGFADGCAATGFYAQNAATSQAWVANNKPAK
jgi:hypothetical protein